MEICLNREIVERLSPHGIMSYVAVLMAGEVEATTAALAGLVRVQTAVMLDGLKELAVEAPTLVERGRGEGHNNKWWCNGFRPLANGDGVQILESNRYREFVDDLMKYWNFLNPHIPFSMGAKDGAAIRGFLRDHPNWENMLWRIALNNRAKSPVVKSAPLFTWVQKLGEYAAGPLNEFNRPQEGTGKIGQAIGIEQSNRAAREVAFAQAVNGSGAAH